LTSSTRRLPSVLGDLAPAWKLIQGSRIEIEPSEFDSQSFGIRGWSFEREAIENSRLALTGKYDFVGQGRLVDRAGYPTLYYHFEGFEKASGRGVARYELHVDEHGQEIFIGEFTGGQQSPVRIVFGKKIPTNDRGNYPDLLREYLRDCLQNPPGFLST
jgi:hypothetical protein